MEDFFVQSLSNVEKKGYLKNNYKLFYLRDNEPREFQFHYHEFDKIIIFLKGKVTYLIEGKTYVLSPYDIVLVGHHDIHKVVIGNENEYERIIFYISPSFLESFWNDQIHLEMCFDIAKEEHVNVYRLNTQNQNKLFDTMLNLKERLINKDTALEFAEEYYQRLLFIEFLIHLNRAVIKEKVRRVDDRYCNKKVIEIIDYINENLTTEMTCDTLSDCFYISKYHMMRIFKKETGYSIGNYINHKRLLKAKDLILQDIPITEVCYSCGFKDYSTFSRRFKSFFQISPRQMKRKKELRL